MFDSQSGKRHFVDMRKMTYEWRPQDDQYFTLAFSKAKDMANKRKLWL